MPSAFDSHQSSSILVVDDDEMLNYLFCSFLESKGLNTISASSVADAKAVLQGNATVDLILLDYQLGDGVGLDLLSSASNLSLTEFPPVIMISANEEPEFLAACFQAGVNDYIIKPVNLSLLALKVEALIQTIKMQHIIAAQNQALEKFKQEAEREEQIAKFTYEYLVKQNSHEYEGIEYWLQSSVAFSGDMVLVRKSPSGAIYFFMVDATGHGLSAAITIMPLVTIFNSKVSSGHHLQQIVTELNRKLVTDTPDDKFVAALLMEINPHTQEISVWNGGMPSAYLVQDRQIVHEFKSQHMSLGILDDAMFDASVQTITLPQEGLLFACSDGLIEQEARQGEAFGLLRVKKLISDYGPSTLLAACKNQLYDHVDTTHFTDDVTVGIIDLNKTLSAVEHAKRDLADTRDLSTGQGPFEWSVKLSGDQLRTCPLAPLVSQFLQAIGVDQQFCQKVFAVVAEMVSNAVDHGVLNLSSSLKEGLDGFVAYYAAREQGFLQLTDQDFVKISLCYQQMDAGPRLVIDVEDSGKGYSGSEESSVNDAMLSGRGMMLIRSLSERIEIFSPGNKIRATLK